MKISRKKHEKAVWALEDMNELLKRQLNDLSHNCTRLENASAKLKLMNMNQKDTILGLRYEIENLNGRIIVQDMLIRDREIRSREDVSSDQKKNMIRKNAEIDGLYDDLERRDELIATLNEQIEALKEQNQIQVPWHQDQCVPQINALNDKIEKLQKKIEDQWRTITDAQDEIDRQKLLKKDADAEISRLRDVNRVMENDMKAELLKVRNDWNTDYHKQKNTIAELKTVLSNCQADVEDRDHTISDQEDTIKELKFDVYNLGGDVTP